MYVFHRAFHYPHRYRHGSPPGSACPHHVCGSHCTHLGASLSTPPHPPSHWAIPGKTSSPVTFTFPLPSRPTHLQSRLHDESRVEPRLARVFRQHRAVPDHVPGALLHGGQERRGRGRGLSGLRSPDAGASRGSLVQGTDSREDPRTEGHRGLPGDRSTTTPVLSVLCACAGGSRGRHGHPHSLYGQGVMTSPEGRHPGTPFFIQF